MGLGRYKMPRFVSLLCGKAPLLATEQFSSRAHRSLADWFVSEPGKRLVQRETELIRERVRRFHGDSLLWLGPAPNATESTSRCMVKTRLYACRSLSAARLDEIATFVATSESLPIPSNSIDGVVVHHGLECADDPRSSIREITRVVRPGGRLLVCCFNPLSLWAIGRLGDDLKSVTTFRLNDWLAVLGFVRDGAIQYLNYRSTLKLKLASDRWQKASDLLNRSQIPLGGAFMTLATKESLAGIRQSRRFVHARKNIAPLTIPKPTTRQ